MERRNENGEDGGALTTCMLDHGSAPLCGFKPRIHFSEFPFATDETWRWTSRPECLQYLVH
jgi:hypothetical protein